MVHYSDLFEWQKNEYKLIFAASRQVVFEPCERQCNVFSASKSVYLQLPIRYYCRVVTGDTLAHPDRIQRFKSHSFPLSLSLLD